MRADNKMASGAEGVTLSERAHAGGAASGSSGASIRAPEEEMLAACRAGCAGDWCEVIKRISRLFDERRRTRPERHLAALRALHTLSLSELWSSEVGPIDPEDAGATREVLDDMGPGQSFDTVNEELRRRRPSLPDRQRVQLVDLYFASLEPPVFPLTTDAVLRLHGAVLRHSEGAGVWATIQRAAGPTTFAHPKVIPSRTASLVQWVNGALGVKDPVHVVQVAMVFLARFLYIHPFADGNGRTGRLLVNWLLREMFPTPILLVDSSSRDAYLLALRTADHFRYVRAPMAPLATYALNRFLVTADMYACATDD